MLANINSRNIQAGFSYAASNLSANQKLLNTLNLFPVADGDTGTNMYMSIKKVNENLRGSDTPKELFRQAADILLNYSLGNSGTIMALFFQGLYNELPESKVIDEVALSKSVTAGYLRSYNYTSNPVEGTILSVARKLSDLSLIQNNEFDDEGYNPWNRLCKEAFSVLPLTAIQNPFLVKDNILDAGAFGFCMILDGFRLGYEVEANQGLDTLPNYKAMKSLLPVIQRDSSIVVSKDNNEIPHYCTEMVISLASSLSKDVYDEMYQLLNQVGDCLLIVPADTKLKVHIHTGTPERVRGILNGYGTEISYKAEDMLAHGK